MDAVVGAGGWGYFRVPGADPLEAYARAFRFVETNVTFYRHVPAAQVRQWRRRVPEDFTFTVKAHRRITHEEGLQPTAAAIEALARSLAMARLLRAPVLVLQTPATVSLDAKRARGMAQLLSTAERQGITFALHARAHATGPLPPALGRAMRDLGVADATDFVQQAPRVEGDVAYGRLFGRDGRDRHELSESELRRIDTVGERTGGARVFFTFHGVRMYKDAARFLIFRRTGRFPTAANRNGLPLVSEGSDAS